MDILERMAALEGGRKEKKANEGREDGPIDNYQKLLLSMGVSPKEKSEIYDKATDSSIFEHREDPSRNPKETEKFLAESLAKSYKTTKPIEKTLPSDVFGPEGVFTKDKNGELSAEEPKESGRTKEEGIQYLDSVKPTVLGNAIDEVKEGGRSIKEELGKDWEHFKKRVSSHSQAGSYGNMLIPHEISMLGKRTTSNLINNITGTAFKLALTENAEKGLEDLTNSIVENASEYEPVKNTVKKIMDTWGTLPPLAQGAIVDAGAQAEFGLNVLSLGAGGKTANVLAKDATLVAKKVGQATIEGAQKTGDAALKVGEVALKGTEIIGSGIKTGAVAAKDGVKAPFKAAAKLAEIKRLPGDTRTTPDEQGMGFTRADVEAMQGKEEALNKYSKEALKEWVDPNAGIYNMAAKSVKDTIKKFDKNLSDTGTELGKMREGFSGASAKKSEISNLKSNFNKQLDKLGYEFSKKKNSKKKDLVRQKGRDLKLSNEEGAFVVSLRQSINKLKKDPNLQRVLDVRMNIDSVLDFDKTKEFVYDKTQNLAKAVRADLKNILDNSSELHADLVKKYAKSMELRKTFEQASSKGNSIDLLFDRALGKKSKKSRLAFDGLKEFTGVDLLAEARALRMASSLLHPKKAEGLRGIMKNAGVNLLTVANPKLGLVKTAYEGIKDIGRYFKKRKGIDPLYEKALEDAKTIQGLDRMSSKAVQ